MADVNYGSKRVEFWRSIVDVRKVNRWLSELFVFKMYHFIAAMLFSAVAYHGRYSLGTLPEIQLQAVVRDGLVAGIGTWLSIALVLRTHRDLRLNIELCTSPVEWSKAATGGTLLFFTISIFLSAPLFFQPYALTTLAVAMAELIAAVSGISTYFWIYWQARDKESRVSIETLKAEHQVWSTIFSCTTIAFGVFVGGVVISSGVGGALPVLRDRFANVSTDVIDKVILYHAVAALYAAISVILWMLRPIHRRLEQISSAMDLLVKDKLPTQKT